ncbi:MAG TPA: CYTH and CHAD domain-containing protein [Streptosporangiaceae bacterium]|nr:CYTH and CHAD domain-containing protein [Streptosporangiaceae bacterium]
MTTEIQEVESKFEATPGFELPVLDGLPQVADVSRGEVETLTAEYYDTEDLRLIRAGITLRRREGGADEGWHLKLPDGKPSSRRELRAPLGNTVPDELARLVRGHARGAALRPVARVETRRRTTTLRDSAGNSLAEIAEDDVTAQSLGSATTVSRWNEVEAELTGGPPRLLRAVDKRLNDAGLRPGMTATKVQRALATSLPRPTGSPDKLNTGSPSGEVVMAYLGEQAAKLKALDTAVRRDEPDAIHQMRVTARRLRSTLQSFPMIWLPSTTDHVKDELKWLGQVLGEARDTEVLSEYFRAALAGVPAELMLGPARARVTKYFAGRGGEAVRTVREALDSRRYFKLLDELDLLAGELPRTPAARAPAREILPDAVARTYRRTKRRMRRARQAPAGSRRDAALHETRKAAKRARYAAEAVAPVFGKRARRFAKRMKAIQSALGEHQDAVTARGVARDIGIQAHMAGENGFTFGLLLERAHRGAQDIQPRARRAWKRAKRRKSLSWLAR